MTVRQESQLTKFLILFLLLAAPLHAQTIPQDFRGWFLEQVAGKPFGQQTLLNLEPILPCVGSALTPPNASGERTKIWDPRTEKWTRVGFGEGYWVWNAQGDGSPPVLQSCAPNATPAILPSPPSPATLDLTAVYSRLDSLTVSVAAIAAQNERIFANETQQIQNLSDQLQAHDEKTSTLVALFSNRYTQLILATVGTYLTTHQVMK